MCGQKEVLLSPKEGVLLFGPASLLSPGAGAEQFRPALSDASEKAAELHKDRDQLQSSQLSLSLCFSYATTVTLQPLTLTLYTSHSRPTAINSILSDCAHAREVI